jgi:hypothetical protein
MNTTFRPDRDYIQAVTKRNGRIYYYTRIPGPNGYIKLRLSDDRDVARRQARRLVESIPANAMSVLLTQLIAGSKARAKARGMAHTVTPAFIYERMVLQDGRCAVTGIPFEIDTGKDKSPFERPFAPSLDRIDNRLGYTSDNVRLVCRIVNFAANRWGLDAVVRMAEGLLLSRGRTETDLKTPEHLENFPAKA